MRYVVIAIAAAASAIVDLAAATTVAGDDIPYMKLELERKDNILL